MIPPLPKNYDVENRGHYSAGRLRPTKKPTKTKAKPNTTSTYGNDVEGEGTSVAGVIPSPSAVLPTDTSCPATRSRHSTA
jgi:hypothetical protein